MWSNGCYHVEPCLLLYLDWRNSYKALGAEPLFRWRRCPAHQWLGERHFQLPADMLPSAMISYV